MKLLFCVLAFVAIFAVNIHGQDSASDGRKSEDQSICSLPITVGPCRGAIPAYGYDSEKGCIKFIYGGCDGNPNNFETLDNCKAACECEDK